MKFTDRSDAGRRLAGKLVHFKERQPVVLALPRGGVAIGFRLDDREGSTAVVRGGSPDVGNWH